MECGDVLFKAGFDGPEPVASFASARMRVREILCASCKKGEFSPFFYFLFSLEKLSK